MAAASLTWKVGSKYAWNLTTFPFSHFKSVWALALVVSPVKFPTKVIENQWLVQICPLLK